MNVKLQSRHFRVTQNLNQLIDRQSGKVRKLLPSFADEDLDLHINVEKLSTGKQFHTVLVLNVPQKAVRVEAIEPSPSVSILRAFGELKRRVKRFKSQLNRHRYWHREVEPAPGSLKPTVPSKSAPDSGEISLTLERIESFLRREIYHQAIQQGIPPGVLQPQALVDEVYLRVRSELESPKGLPLDQWLFQVARSTLQDRITGLRANSDNPHVEESSNEVEKWDDESLHFYQPDEVLRLEDVLTDEHSSTPEEYLAREETEVSIHKSIAGLPDSLREAFVLFALEGFNSDEVAKITGKTPAEVLTAVNEARERLHADLGQ